MPNSQNNEKQSCSHSYAAQNSQLANELRCLTVQTLSSPELSHVDDSSMLPDPEHSRYFNRQSTKVNSGLSFSGRRQSTESVNDNTSAIDVGFSQSNFPTQTPQTVSALPSTEQLIHTLLHPPPHAFPQGVLSFQWVVGALGYCHFVLRESDERYTLSSDSLVREEGGRLGMPIVYMEWLCGDDEHSSPTEQAMLLTEHSFESLNEE